jgi:hypothetical protein
VSLAIAQSSRMSSWMRAKRANSLAALPRAPGPARRATAAVADSALRSRCAPPGCRERRQSSSCRSRSGPRDTAQEQPFEIFIHYPTTRARVNASA